MSGPGLDISHPAPGVLAGGARAAGPGPLGAAADQPSQPGAGRGDRGDQQPTSVIARQPGPAQQQPGQLSRPASQQPRTLQTAVTNIMETFCFNISPPPPPPPRVDIKITNCFLLHLADRAGQKYENC